MTLAATITTHAQHSRMAAIPATTFGTMDEEDWFGLESWKRYPNGDGFVIYPGKPVGMKELNASIRIKQVREGAED